MCLLLGNPKLWERDKVVLGPVHVLFSEHQGLKLDLQRPVRPGSGPAPSLSAPWWSRDGAPAPPQVRLSGHLWSLGFAFQSQLLIVKQL